MPGSSSAEALNTYLSALHRALSCVTRAIIQVGSYQPVDTPQALFLNGFQQEFVIDDLNLPLLKQAWKAILAETRRPPTR